MRTEFYESGAYAAESCVFGFPWVFIVSANMPKYGNQEGPIEVQLAVSRDLETWSRPFRTPVIPLGKPGEWDGGMILSASQAIDVGDEVWLSYGGANHTHGAPALYDTSIDGRGTKVTTATGLATWKKDRFVSADAPASGGTLLTVHPPTCSLASMRSPSRYADRPHAGAHRTVRRSHWPDDRSGTTDEQAEARRP